MEEVVVDHREIVAMIHCVHQLLAHAHQRGGSAGRKVEAPEQLEPSRLGCTVDLGCCRVRGRALPGSDCGAEPFSVHAEAARKRLEEGDARTGRQFGVAREDFAGERHPRGFAAAGQEILAELGEVGRALLGDTSPVARAVDERAAAFRDRLQHIAEG